MNKNKKKKIDNDFIHIIDQLSKTKNGCSLIEKIIASHTRPKELEKKVLAAIKEIDRRNTLLCLITVLKSKR